MEPVTVSKLAQHLARLVNAGWGDVVVITTGSDNCSAELDELPTPTNGRLYL